MPLTLPHTFVDGPGNIASGAEVMDNFNAVNAGVAAATVTSLPASPVNGQECYYLADATNGVVWHLKYRSASASAYKWECVGGRPLRAEVINTQSRSNATYGDLATVGPSVTVPLAGEYDIRIEAMIGIPAGSTAGSGALASIQIGGAAAVDGDSIEFTAYTGGTTTQGATVGRDITRTVSPAGIAVKMVYRGLDALAYNYTYRRLGVIPVRVG